MTFGPFKTRGASAKELKRIDAMHQEEHTLQPEKHVDQHIEEHQKAVMQAWHDAAIADDDRKPAEQKHGTWDTLDNSMKVVADHLIRR